MNENEKIDKGQVEECLKEALLNHQITDKLCKAEIIELVYEGKADISADPVLHSACTKDLQDHCSHIENGAGRSEFQCLAIVSHFLG